MAERDYLEPHEFDQLLKAVPKASRTASRDRCLLVLMYRHGLRATEACRLQLSQIDLEGKVIHVKRIKNGRSLTHPLYPDEIPVIRAWLKEREKWQGADRSQHVFLAMSRLFAQPLSRFSLYKVIQAAGKAAAFPFGLHPHMLRHSCGYALANRGADTRLIQDYLGHTQIQSTVRYTTINPRRFERLWQ